MKSEFSQAITSYLYAKELAKLIRDNFWEAAALWRIAEVHRKRGEFENAIATAETAREKFIKIGNPRMVAKSDCAQAAAYLQTGVLDKAYDLYNTSMDIFTASEDVPMIQSIYIGLALTELAYESKRPTPNYRKPLQNFLDIDTKRHQLHDPYLLAYNDLAYAEALRLAGYTERALTRFDSVIQTSQKYGLQLERAHALLGISATKQLRAEADRESCNEALKIYQKVGSLWGQIQALIVQAFIEQDRGQVHSRLLQEAALLARNHALVAESKLIERYLSNNSLQNQTHVLLFIQAV